MLASKAPIHNMFLKGIDMLTRMKTLFTQTESAFFTSAKNLVALGSRPTVRLFTYTGPVHYNDRLASMRAVCDTISKLPFLKESDISEVQLKKNSPLVSLATPQTADRVTMYTLYSLLARQGIKNIDPQCDDWLVMHSLHTPQQQVLQMKETLKLSEDSVLTLCATKEVTPGLKVTVPSEANTESFYLVHNDAINVRKEISLENLTTASPTLRR